MIIKHLQKNILFKQLKINSLEKLYCNLLIIINLKAYYI